MRSRSDVLTQGRSSHELVIGGFESSVQRSAVSINRLGYPCGVLSQPCDGPILLTTSRRIHRTVRFTPRTARRRERTNRSLDDSNRHIPAARRLREAMLHLIGATNHDKEIQGVAAIRRADVGMTGYGVALERSILFIRRPVASMQRSVLSLRRPFGSMQRGVVSLDRPCSRSDEPSPAETGLAQACTGPSSRCAGSLRHCQETSYRRSRRFPDATGRCGRIQRVVSPLQAGRER